MNIQGTPAILIALKCLRDADKFLEEDFYPGAPAEEIRLDCQRRVNEFLDEIIDLLRKGTTRDDVLARTGVLTQSFEMEDTEEKEKVDDYIGETMRVIGVDDWIDHI